LKGSLQTAVGESIEAYECIQKVVVLELPNFTPELSNRGHSNPVLGGLLSIPLINVLNQTKSKMPQLKTSPIRSSKEKEMGRLK
jgi:hypothetical protein